MDNFKPTYLYIKQHNKTGLKYFGKTTKEDPVKYTGSGIYWQSHLKKHGKDISTLWYQRFYDQKSLTEYALVFSEENNISESEEWANLKYEDGLEGGFTGTPRSEETKRKLSIANRGKLHLEETKSKISNSNIGKHNIRKSKEAREKMIKARKSQIRKPHSEETKQRMRKPHGRAPVCSCLSCKKILSTSNLARHVATHQQKRIQQRNS
jgi:hypothetical protein